MTISDVELLAWFDELLPAERMVAVERAMRDSEAVRRQASEVVRRRDQGGNSLGEIWRRNRLSCPSRADLGSFLLETLESDHARYVEFHVRSVGCRYCLALLDDMTHGIAAASPDRHERRRRLFESSATLLPRGDGPME